MATIFDVNNTLKHLIITVFIFVDDQAAGTKTIVVINHPAPKGRGKYSVQKELGTVFENRN
ncbi:MAG: hypothetical protein ACR2PX_04020 [Endozoicomonas sp.]